MSAAGKVEFGLTMCMAADDDGRLAVKQITPTEVIPYGFVYLWRFTPVIETSLAAMAERLQWLAHRPRRMIVMGHPVAGIDLAKAHRRLSRDPAEATLMTTPKAWLPIDVDGVRVPAGLGRGDRLVDAAVFIRDHYLTPEFHGARLIVTPTARTGMVGDDVARLRLFAALSRPHPILTLNAWTKGARIALDLPLDPAGVHPSQPNYTGRPLFDGVDDPVPRHLLAVILDGDRDLVDLGVDRFTVQVRQVEARVKQLAHACGTNWRALLDAGVGDETGFYAPLTKGLGIAALAGADHAEVQAVVKRLLAERANPGRQRQYGHAWVESTLANFEKRDGRVRAEIARVGSRLFLPRIQGK
jgi:hypothetical protein